MRTSARIKSYYSQHNFVCHFEKTNVVLEQIRTRIRTSCYYSPNKILIARITYYYRENKFTSNLEQ
jgi:hypothetical protein